MLAGCLGGGARVQTASASVTPAVIAAPVMISSAAYVAAASSIDLYEMKSAELARWLKKSREIQWDYKNIVKNRGKLNRLK